MKNDNIFQKGDRVYHYRWGWGDFKSYTAESGRCVVNFDKEGPGSGRFLYANELSFIKYTLEDGGLSQERPLKLKVGKSYVHKEVTDSIVVNRKGADGNYGFWRGEWRDNIYCNTKCWREATDEEVREALQKEV